MKAFILDRAEKNIEEFVERRLISQKFLCELVEGENGECKLYIYPYEDLKKELFVVSDINLKLYENYMDNSETLAQATQDFYLYFRTLCYKLQSLIYEFEHWTEVTFRDESSIYFKHKIEYTSHWLITTEDPAINQKRTLINREVVFMCRQL